MNEILDFTIEQEKEHAKRLIELKRAGSPEGIFVQSDSARIDTGVNLFKGLADEEGKQKMMAQDVYDLQELRRV